MVYTCGALVETSQGPGFESEPEKIQSDEAMSGALLIPSYVRPPFKPDSDPFPYFSVRMFAELAAREATAEVMEDGRYFVESRTVPGVWGDGDTEDAARAEFLSAAYEWAMVKIEKGHRDIPVLDSINLNQI